MTFQENQNLPRSHPGHGQGPAGASLSDLLTAVQHVASNIAQLGQTLLQINGTQTATGLTGAAAILLKQGPGRVVKVSLPSETGGPVTGSIIDANTATATGPVIYTITGAVGLYEVNLPFSLGLVVIPGAGNNVTVSFS
jgi:hypothetical protein